MWPGYDLRQNFSASLDMLQSIPEGRVQVACTSHSNKRQDAIVVTRVSKTALRMIPITKRVLTQGGLLRVSPLVMFPATRQTSNSKNVE